MTKAETLMFLKQKGFSVPDLVYFTAKEWQNTPKNCLQNIHNLNKYKNLAVRSSSLLEDSTQESFAGAFHSVLNVLFNDKDLSIAIADVVNSLKKEDDQIIIQEMVENVSMSGVLMTRTLDDGSPYYCVNYDDFSGQTNSITNGKGIGKTVYIYRKATPEDFVSNRILSVIELAKLLEKTFDGLPLDIEFALDENSEIYLLQARTIAAAKNWNKNSDNYVEQRIEHVADFVHQLTLPRRGLFGKKTTLGVMPDWNPAEMIGPFPKPLALSLYRELITQNIWRLARESMGYQVLPQIELMVNVAGRPYIDTRASFNSFLPKGLNPVICEKLVNAWLKRLDENPQFHDKIEFEIVHTVLEPNFEEKFQNRYPDTLNSYELEEYKIRLTDLTKNIMLLHGSLSEAMQKIEKLRYIQEYENKQEVGDIADLIEECRLFGTLPFAVLARHAFVAKIWLKAIGVNIPVRTISGKITDDLHKVIRGELSKEKFMNEYGHLRPGMYDILSKPYRERPEIFDVSASMNANAHHKGLSDLNLDSLFAECGLLISTKQFIEYAERAIYAREYAKFIFSKHLDNILNIIKSWGEKMGFEPSELAMLSISDILSLNFSPLYSYNKDFFKKRIEEKQNDYEAMRSFKLSYLIRSPKDVYVVPQHKSEPNYISSKKVKGKTVDLSYDYENINGYIVCIENADPGYDWIFAHKIAGLITCYGGANSHMAIRCAEYDLPAAIGCGERLFQMVCNAKTITLDCVEKAIVFEEKFL
ncbi:MAG: PEP-utilizing enzyme [Fibromonadales bacterium]|nr:PEP-utilizing enzyme [Fibromonadales bacterium]